jgi:peptide/nickel transport system permease protein
MAVGLTEDLGGAPIPNPGPVVTASVPRRGRRMQLPRSPKILVGLGMLAFFLLIAVLGPTLAPQNPAASSSTTGSLPLPPSAAHWLGTTVQQQDVFSQLLAGGRSTVLVAFVAGLLATALSVLIGVTAGFAAGRTDDLLSMLANFFLVMPALPLLIVIFGFLPSSGGSDDALIGAIIAITGWAWGARVLRAQTLSLRNRDYVESARLIGERGWRIIGFEIMPNLIPIIASSFLFTVLYGVGTYTALAFLGLVNPNHWSWGGMFFYAQISNAEVSGYWWWYIPPGLAVALLGTSLALLNFGIDEFINPRLRVAGLSRRQAKRERTLALPRRFVLGLTPVIRPPGAANGSAGTGGQPPGEVARADTVLAGRRWGIRGRGRR